MAIRFLGIGFFAVILFSLSAQTNLSGIINVYGLLQSQSDCPPTIQVANSDDFAPGMAILIVQMGNATIDTDDSNRFGNITNLNGSGQYEYNRIRSISGNELELAYSLQHNYEPQLTQVVGTTIHTDATVTGTLRPRSWDGNTGGILLLECTDALSLQANIDANGLGYRGGRAEVYEDISCSFLTFNRAYSYATGNWRGAPKGEGVAPVVSGAEVGRGPQANGGGGGNNHNSGGGGGALFAAGGQGGENNEPSFGGCDGFFPGLGGKPLPFAANRLYLGGGGGAGHTNNTIDVAGGNGGGVIVILAGSIQFSGGSILANGNAGESPSGDGAGGGGAGGTIIVLADNQVGTPDLQAQGGIGGTVDNGNQERCFGPGGGGSGGALFTNLNLTANLAGGAAGLSQNSQSCGEGTNDASAGQNGRVEMLEGLPQGSSEGAPVNLLGISPDTMLCPGELLQLEAQVDNTEADFQWQYLQGGSWIDLMDNTSVNGVNTPLLSLQESPMRVGSYRLLVSPFSDCYQPLTTEPITVSEFELPSAAPTFVRNGNMVQFNSNAVATENYFWFFRSGATSMEANPSFTFPGEGTYTINLTVTNDCGSATYPIEISINAPVVADAQASVRRGCAPLAIRFNDLSTGPVEERLWTFPGGMPATSTEANPLVIFSEVGGYEVTLEVSNEEMSDEINLQIQVVDAPFGDFVWMAIENQVQFNNTSDNVFTYLWDFGDGNMSTEPNPFHTYSQSGSYEVTLNTSNGSCAVASGQTVTVIVNSTEELEEARPITIFPNPTRGYFMLRGAAGSSASLYNLQGQVLQRWTVTEDQQGLTLLSTTESGTLLLVVEKDGEREVLRVVNMPD